jgi:ABC-2 type transport system ATP-binding protein
LAAVLSFEEVTKEYRHVWRPAVRALESFSVTVERGEIFGFLGPNGAGKTTAIHIAMGFMRATSGRGTMLGARFGNARVRARVGFLAENVAFYHRPAGALLEFYGALNRVGDGELRRQTREALEAVGLGSERKRSVAKFSRGMLQRFGLAQALINEPELLILDEPTSALDPATRVAFRELMLRKREQGTTIFLSSHLLSEVELISDRVAILNHGRLVRTGATRDLLQQQDEVEIVARGVREQIAGSMCDSRDGVQTMRVPAPAQRAAIERVWAAGGEIVSVNPVRRSLEQVFLELTQSAKRGNDHAQ